MSEKTELNKRGEDAAAAYLERVGICAFERHWRCEAGIIDILGWDGDVLVIASVKTRTTGSSVYDRKLSEASRRRITRLAEAYIANADLDDVSWRYDVIDVRVIAADRALLRHFRGALYSQPHVGL